MRPNTINMVGRKYSSLTVVEHAGSYMGRGAKWLCRCDCGNTAICYGVNLRKGKHVSCGCMRRGKNSKNFSGHMDIGSHYWGHVKSNAKIRNIQFSITIEEAWDLFEKQGRKCALSDLPLSLEFSSAKNGPIPTASLDRIDNSKGYVLENLQWLHKDVNLMKLTHNQEYFIELCRLIGNKNGFN